VKRLEEICQVINYYVLLADAEIIIMVSNQLKLPPLCRMFWVFLEFLYVLSYGSHQFFFLFALMFWMVTLRI